MGEGQYTGKKKVYIYKTDAGTETLVKLDETLGSISQLGLQLASTGDLKKPVLVGVSPRKVHWQGEVGGLIKSKSLTCNPESSAYKSDVSVAFEIDGSSKGGTTGRTGEKKTFIRIDNTNNDDGNVPNAGG